MFNLIHHVDMDTQTSSYDDTSCIIQQTKLPYTLWVCAVDSARVYVSARCKCDYVTWAA